MPIFDVHKELYIQPYKKGVKIIKFNENLALNNIGTLFNSSMLAYFLTPEVTLADANHFTLLTSVPDYQGYASENDIRNKPLTQFFKKSAVEQLTCNNNLVVQKKEMVILEEEVVRLDEISFSCISFKFPLYNAHNSIIGLLGMSTLLSPHPLLSTTSTIPIHTSLEAIINTGLLPQTQTNAHSSHKNLLPGCVIKDAYLSSQELKCLRLLVLGKSIKMIANTLNLSSRTVEQYLNSVKHKLQAYSKPDLIEKALQSIWPECLALLSSD